MRGSIIIAVLESYNVVERQLKWFSGWLNKYKDWEFILVDDGSDPEIQSIPVPFNFTLLQTHDKRPWSQPCARNFGAKHARGEYLFFTDIDHIITEEAVQAVNNFKGDMLRFKRVPGVLNHFGEIIDSPEVLEEYGLRPDRRRPDEHYNTFAIRKSIFIDQLRGYDSKFCGKYGGDDTDFMNRYGVLHYAGQVERSVQSMVNIFVYPDPKFDKMEVFHSLRRKEIARREKAKRKKENKDG